MSKSKGKKSTSEEMLEMLRVGGDSEVEEKEASEAKEKKPTTPAAGEGKEEGEEKKSDEKKADEDIEEALRASVAEIASLKASASQPSDGGDSDSEKKSASQNETHSEEEKKSKEIKLDSITISDNDVISLFDEEGNFDKSAMESLLNQAATHNMKAVTELIEGLREDMLRSIPGTVNRLVQDQVALSELVREFYDNNKDLKPYKEPLHLVATKLAAENPEWGAKKLFEESGKEVRRLLRMRNASDSPANGGKGKPKLPGGTPPRAPAVPTLEGFEKQFAELL